MENIENYLRGAVRTLADDIGSRTFKSIQGLEKARDFITEQLTSFGYRVSEQLFVYKGSTYYNLIAEVTGHISPEKVLVVGAHYDTVQGTPGADDNASGVAGLLGLARAFSGASLRKSVRFVAFGLEEPPVYRSSDMGSFHYARSLWEKDEQVEGMICLEMIGYFTEEKNSQRYPLPGFRLKYPSEGNFISIVGDVKSRAFTESIADGFREAVDLPVVSLNALPLVIGIDFSDHWSFYKFGYQACMVTDTAFFRNPHYHAPSDLPETLDYERMAKVVEGLSATIERWSCDTGETGKMRSTGSPLRLLVRS